MIQDIERIDVLNWTVLALFVFGALLVVLAVIAWQEHEGMLRERKRAEENWLWSELHLSEVAAVRKRLADVERRHMNLQQQYAHLRSSRTCGASGRCRR